MQGWVKQFASDITREGATGAIGPLFAGPQANDQQLGTEFAKGRNG